MSAVIDGHRADLVTDLFWHFFFTNSSIGTVFQAIWSIRNLEAVARKSFGFFWVSRERVYWLLVFPASRHVLQLFSVWYLHMLTFSFVLNLFLKHQFNPPVGRKHCFRLAYTLQSCYLEKCLLLHCHEITPSLWYHICFSNLLCCFIHEYSKEHKQSIPGNENEFWFQRKCSIHTVPKLFYVGLCANLHFDVVDGIFIMCKTFLK